MKILIFTLVVSGCSGRLEKRIKKLESRIMELEAELALCEATPPESETSYIERDENGL